MGKRKKNKKSFMKSAVIVLFGSVSAIFLAWNFSLTAPKLPDPPLKELARAHNIDLGVHLIAQRLNDRIYPDLASSQFASVTVEGLHFKPINPKPQKYDFSKPDKIVSFAENQNMPVQFHHLVWGDAHFLPDWLKKGNFSKKQLLEILHNHITRIVDRYKGRVREYSAVNEAFTEAQHVYGLQNWWADHISNDVSLLDKFFIWAHRADPTTKLLLNDFNNETKNSVSDAMYVYLKSAKNKGVPVDGIGMQMHINASHPPKKNDVINNMKRFGRIGTPVYITEFDINTNSVEGNDAYKNELEAQITYDMVRACIESKACNSFSVFGLTSKNDTLKKIMGTNSRSYMYNSRFRPRPSFYSFRQAWLDP